MSVCVCERERERERERDVQKLHHTHTHNQRERENSGTLQRTQKFTGFLFKAPQWGAADAEIKVPSGENTELKRSPFKAWSRSVYSLYLLPGISSSLIATLPVHSPAFFSKTSPDFFLCWLLLTPVPV